MFSRITQTQLGTESICVPFDLCSLHANELYGDSEYPKNISLCFFKYGMLAWSFFFLLISATAIFIAIEVRTWSWSRLLFWQGQAHSYEKLLRSQGSLVSPDPLSPVTAQAQPLHLYWDQSFISPQHSGVQRIHCGITQASPQHTP